MHGCFEETSNSTTNLLVRDQQIAYNKLISLVIWVHRQLQTPTMNVILGWRKRHCRKWNKFSLLHTVNTSLLTSRARRKRLTEKLKYFTACFCVRQASQKFNARPLCVSWVRYTRGAEIWAATFTRRKMVARL